MPPRTYGPASLSDIVQLGHSGPLVVGSDPDVHGQCVRVEDPLGSPIRLKVADGKVPQDAVSWRQLSELRIASSGPEILAPRTDLPTILNIALDSTALGTVAPTLGTLRLWPFVPCKTLTVSQVRVRITAAGAGSFFRILAYSSDASRYPSTKILETADLSGASTGAIGQTLGTPMVFEEGKVYWTGVHVGTAGTAPTLRGVAVAAQLSFPLYVNDNATAPFSLIQLTSLALGGAPATWTFAVSQFGTNLVCPTIFATVTAVS